MYKKLFFLNALIIATLLYQYWAGSQIFSGNQPPSFYIRLSYLINSIWVPLLVLDIYLIVIKEKVNNWEKFKLLFKDKTNPLGRLLYFFGLYLCVAYPLNFATFLVWGDGDTVMTKIFYINLYTLAVFALIGFLKGLLLLRRK